MPQALLPFFPEGVTHITPLLAFKKNEQGDVIYFNGSMPLFSHAVEDKASFRMITAQFCANGNVRQADISRAFGVPKISIRRAVSLYRRQGAKGFFAPRKSRGAAVLTPAVIEQAQALFDDGFQNPDVAKELDIKPDTLRKAVAAGKLRGQKKKTQDANSTKSERSTLDKAALMGMGATDVEGRMAASLGEGAFVLPEFQTALDLPNAGVLLALPALLSIGLLKQTHKHFQLPKGFYGLDSLFLLLAFMALARLKFIESLRYCSPGEWGKLLGLDRIPEVRTLRDKIRLLTRDDQARQWSEELCQQWMHASPEAAGVLYIDGHVRVYNGHQTQLPRHHVARQRLCLRATTDYWVNAMDGQPFFVVNQVVDPGLIKVLEQDILPRLERDVPLPPDYQSSDPLSHRFTLVFDREGYSPDFLKRMKEKQVACLTYHKFPGDDWPEDEFTGHRVTTANGEVVELKLAERGTCLRNHLWVREIRKLTKRGHQTSVLCTDYRSNLVPIASSMFARWSQENFFKYLREQYSLDRLADYCVEDISEPIQVVNPEYRSLDGQVRSLNGQLTRLLAQYGAMNLESCIEPAEVEAFVRRKSDLQEDIEQLQEKIKTLKEKRKATNHHIAVNELPQSEQFQKLSTRSKYLIDTIKMVAYRAETAMADILRKSMSHTDEARRLLQALYTSEADLIPDKENKTLTVSLHHMANNSSDKTIQILCDELNETRTLFPQTEIRLIFKLGSN